MPDPQDLEATILRMLLSAPNHSSIPERQPENTFSDADYTAFAANVQTLFSVRLTEYRPNQMRRRVGMMAMQAGCESLMAFLSAIRRDPALLQRFLDQLTINVTELLRNPSLFAELATLILPEIAQNAKGRPLSIWSAGCSYGAEAYSVAILLHEMSPIPQYRIQGTDIDLAVLARARDPWFGKADMASVDQDRRNKHFVELPDGCYSPTPLLQRNVAFAQHDLLSSEYPIAKYDLVLCRNVVIYFNDEAKERIFAHLRKALRPGGILFLGGTERLADSAAFGFELIRPFFYRAKESATGITRLAG